MGATPTIGRGILAVSDAVKKKLKAKSDAAERMRSGQGGVLSSDYASRMARAKEQGFNTDKRMFHGTQSTDIESINPLTFFTEHSGEAGGYAGAGKYRDAKYVERLKNRYKGVEIGDNPGRVGSIGVAGDIPSDDVGRWYATDNGVIRRREGGGFDVATDFVSNPDLTDYDYNTHSVVRGDGAKELRDIQDFTMEGTDKYDTDYTGGNIIPSYLKDVKTYEMPPLEANVLGKRLDDGSQEFAEKRSNLLTKIEKLKEDGYRAISTTSDQGLIDPDLAGTKQIIPLYSEDIRSVNAMFDPAKKDSSNLLASAAPAAVGLGALAASDDSAAGTGGVLTAPAMVDSIEDDRENPYLSSAMQALDYMDIPTQGLYGLAMGGYGMLTGESDPLHQASRVSGQPIDATSQEFGDWIFKKTKSPAAAALGLGLANIFGPI